MWMLGSYWVCEMTLSLTQKIEALPSEPPNPILTPSSQLTDSISTRVEARHPFFNPASFIRYRITGPYAICQAAP